MESGRPNLRLHQAAATGDDSTIQLLLAHQSSSSPNTLFAPRPNIDETDVNGDTALHLAAKNDHLLSVYLLLTARAKPNIENHEGFTPFHLAWFSSKASSKAIRDALTEAGAYGKEPAYYEDTLEAVLWGELAVLGEVLRLVTNELEAFRNAKHQSTFFKTMTYSNQFTNHLVISRYYDEKRKGEQAAKRFMGELSNESLRMLTQFLALENDCDRVSLQYLSKWFECIKRQNPQYVVFSIGSSGPTRQQQLPSFIRKNKQAKFAVLNMDKFPNQTIHGKHFSCTYMDYFLKENSTQMALIQSFIADLINSGKQVIFMTFPSPLFCEKIKPLLRENCSHIGSSFSYVLGYFDFYPVVIWDKQTIASDRDIVAEASLLFSQYPADPAEGEHPLVRLMQPHASSPGTRIVQRLEDVTLQDLGLAVAPSMELQAQKSPIKQ